MATSGCSTELNQLQQLSGCPDNAEELLFIAPSGFSGYSGYGLRTWGDLLDCGLSGFSGYSGFSGGSGSSGDSGLSGYSGFSGSGVSGYSGYSGFSGRSGFSGASGIGTSGFSGYSGDNPGSSGFSGFSGLSGQAGGESGTSGYSGYSGFSGRSGFSGSGLSGYSGFSGDNPGSSGYSGFSGASGQAGGGSGYSGFSGFSGAGGFSGISGFSGDAGCCRWQETLDVPNGSILDHDNRVDGQDFHFFWDSAKHFWNMTANVSETLNAKINIGVATNDKALKITSSRNNAFFQIVDDNSPGNGGLDALNIKSFDKDGDNIFWLSGRWCQFGKTILTQIANGSITINNFGNTKALLLTANNIGSQADNLFFNSVSSVGQLTERMRMSQTGQFGVGTGANLDGSAKLQADSTQQGFLPPRMTTAQRDILTPATGSITIINFAGLTGDTVTIAGHVLTEGVQWTASTSNGATAASLATAIGLLSEVSATSVSSATVTFVSSAASTAGNSTTIAISDSTNMSKSGATMSGGVAPAAGLVIYNTSTNKLNLFTTLWEVVTSA